MRNRVDRIGVKTFSSGGSILNAYNEHLEIYEAIKSGKRGDIYRAIEGHLDKYRDILNKSWYENTKAVWICTNSDCFFCENGVLIQEIKTGIPRTGKEKAMFEKATYKEQAYNYLLDYLSDRPGLGINLLDEVYNAKDTIHTVTKKVRHDQMFAVTGDPWAQSPGDDKAGIIQA